MLNRLRKIPALEEIRPNCVAVVQPVECLAAIHSSEGRSVQPVRAVIAIKSRVTGRELVSKHNNCCRLAFAAAAVAAILLVSPGVAWKGGWGQHTELGWRHDAHPGEDEAVFAIELVEIQIFLTEPNRQLVERDSRHLSKHTCIAVRVQPSNVACRMRQGCCQTPAASTVKALTSSSRAAAAWSARSLDITLWPAPAAAAAVTDTPDHVLLRPRRRLAALPPVFQRCSSSLCAASSHSACCFSRCCFFSVAHFTKGRPRAPFSQPSTRRSS